VDLRSAIGFGHVPIRNLQPPAHLHAVVWSIDPHEISSRTKVSYEADSAMELRQ
jgi:hypothetical protein